MGSVSSSQARWRTPLIPTLGSQRQVVLGFADPEPGLWNKLQDTCGHREHPHPRCVYCSLCSDVMKPSAVAWHLPDTLGPGFDPGHTKITWWLTWVVNIQSTFNISKACYWSVHYHVKRPEPLRPRRGMNGPLWAKVDKQSSRTRDYPPQAKPSLQAYLDSSIYLVTLFPVSENHQRVPRNSQTDSNS